jgi:hypothetical protein
MVRKALNAGPPDDAAKAGRRALFGSTDAQASFGIGLTQLGGLIRLDLARPIHGPRDWRLHLLINRPFQAASGTS